MAKKYAYREQFIGADGIRHNIRANSHKELLDKVAKVKQDIENGYMPLKANNLTVKKWLDRCLSEYKVNITSQTLTGYKSKVNRWIIPIIGHMKIKDVKPLNCQTVMNSMQGKSADTIRKVKQLMYFCFDKAVENGFIRDNPASHINMPKGGKSTHRAITDYERKVILQTVENGINGKYTITDGRYKNADIRYRYVYFLFMLFCGCRPSEVANIKKMDIQDLNGLHVLHIRGTKTVNADRMVPIPDYLYARIPDTNSPFDYLFTNLKGGKLSLENRRALWDSFRRDLNITAGCQVYRNQLLPPYPIAPDLEPYCLRHTYCTDLQKANIDIRQAMYLMGHADIKLTANIYTHQDESTLSEVAYKLNNSSSLSDNEEVKRDNLRVII